jgi:hypothetical protein
MSTEGQDVLAQDATTAPQVARRRGTPESRRLFAYLLDADDDLAQELDARVRVAARHVITVRLLDAEAGECDLSPWLTRVDTGPGLLVLDGLIASDTCVAARTVTELLGAGDLLQPDHGGADEIIEQALAWRALTPARFALLDAEFAQRCQPWPQIPRVLLRRAEHRSRDLSMVRAISCQPKLELRLVLFLWHIAARWGRVEPTGLHLTLPLTHRLLGQLVAAERPSVSHALGRLARAGVVTGTTCDLHLNGDLEQHVRDLAEHAQADPRHELRHRPARQHDPVRT